jgi:hypothetical protein
MFNTGCKSKLPGRGALECGSVSGLAVREHQIALSPATPAPLSVSGCRSILEQLARRYLPIATIVGCDVNRAVHAIVTKPVVP